MDHEIVRKWAWWDDDEWSAYADATNVPRGRPLHGPSYVVDLTQPLKPSKGHKAAIARERPIDIIRCWDSIENYHQLHRIAAGTETRSQESWDIMQRWLDSGLAALLTNCAGAWAYVILFPPGAYYASAVGHDSHHLQHTIMRSLQDCGEFTFYELGAGHTDGIDTFKRGFGCEVVEP